MKNLFLVFILSLGVSNLIAVDLGQGGVFQFEGVGTFAGKYCTVNGVGADEQLAFSSLEAGAADAEVKKTQFKVSLIKDGMYSIESVSNPGYYLYPIRPAGKPWIIGMKKGEIGNDTDFLFKIGNAVTGKEEQISIVPIKNQAWVMGPFTGGIGFHMPGAFGYTEEGHYKGAFLPISANKPNVLTTTFEHGGVYQFEGVGNLIGKYTTVNGLGENDQLGFAPLSKSASKADVLKTQFIAHLRDGLVAFESMSNRGYFIYPIRPAGKPWILGMKKGPIADDKEFLFKAASPAATGNPSEVTFFPIKNQAWVMGPSRGGIGFHLPGAIGYTMEGHWKGAFQIYKSPKTVALGSTDALPLRSGVKFTVDKKLYSADKSYYLIFQEDGNLAVYKADTDLFIWGSYQTSGSFGKAARFQENGNLIVGDGTGKKLWETGTKSQNALLDVNSRGQLVVKSQSGKVLWRSN